jgi:hypothetical protein
MSDQAIYVPAKDYMHVAGIIRTLTENGVLMESLSISVRAGELELGDATGSYGNRTWDR